MENIGGKIKALRIQKEMRQKEFAKGICSNVTLSNIENNKQNPSMEILIKICDKLEIALQDLYGEPIDTEEVKNLTANFDQLQWLCGNHRHREAYILLMEEIAEEQLITICFQKKYYYFLGLTQVIHLEKPDEAIFNFSRTLNTENESKTETIEDVLALNGLGIAYTFKGEMDKAEFYFMKSLEHMKKFETEVLSEQKEMGKIAFNTAKHYSDKKEYKKAVDLCLEALSILINLDSRYHLSALYFLLGYNLFELCDRVNSSKNYFIAKALAYVDNNQHVLDAVDEELEKHKIVFDALI